MKKLISIFSFLWVLTSPINAQIFDPVDWNTSVEKVSENELLSHQDQNDCWVVYENNVYDVTKYIPKHPGGEDKISDQCGGLNFEKEFTKQHGTSKVKLLMKEATIIGKFEEN